MNRYISLVFLFLAFSTNAKADTFGFGGFYIGQDKQEVLTIIQSKYKDCKLEKYNVEDSRIKGSLIKIIQKEYNKNCCVLKLLPLQDSITLCFTRKNQLLPGLHEENKLFAIYIQKYTLHLREYLDMTRYFVTKFGEPNQTRDYFTNARNYPSHTWLKNGGAQLFKVELNTWLYGHNCPVVFVTLSSNYVEDIINEETWYRIHWPMEDWKRQRLRDLSPE